MTGTSGLAGMSGCGLVGEGTSSFPATAIKVTAGEALISRGGTS